MERKFSFNYQGPLISNLFSATTRHGGRRGEVSHSYTCWQEGPLNADCQEGSRDVVIVFDGGGLVNLTYRWSSRPEVTLLDGYKKAEVDFFSERRADISFEGNWFFNSPEGRKVFDCLLGQIEKYKVAEGHREKTGGFHWGISDEALELMRQRYESRTGQGLLSI